MDFKRKGALQESTSVFCGFFSGDKFVLPLIADGRPPSKKNNLLCIPYKNLATSLITRKAMRFMMNISTTSLTYLPSFSPYSVLFLWVEGW